MASNLIAHRPVRLRQYRYPGEIPSLVITLGILLSVYAAMAVFFPTYWSTTLKTVFITLAGLVVYSVGVKLQQRAAFGTLVRVSPRQFPELYDLAMEAAQRLGTQYVPVYVKRASEMNIYTLGFRQRPLIVMTSSLVDQMEPGNLQFFIGREIGHVQAGHMWLRALLKPLGADVPVIGRLLNSFVFGDWINRTELTADRAGLIACRSLTTAVSTMLKFGVGVRLYEKLDIREYLEQINDVRSVGGILTEIVAEQPYLTQRVRALARYSMSEGFEELVPEKHGHTEILQSLPETFLTAGTPRRGYKPLAALDKSPSNQAAIAKPGASVSQRIERDTVFDEDIAVEDADLIEDDNDFDPRMFLAGVEGDYPLRRLRTRIGRERDNDIVLDSDRISRYHVELQRRGGLVMVIDKKSRNGVWLNGRRLREPKPIRSGDLLRIGRTEFTFHLKEQKSR